MDYISENILTKRELINKIHEYNNDQFIISIDRQKNLDTFIKYDIDKDDIYNYINLLTEKNYKKYINNLDSRYKCKYLYQFRIVISLFDEFGISTRVPIYIKVGFHINGKILYVVSFHEDDD